MLGSPFPTTSLGRGGVVGFPHGSVGVWVGGRLPAMGWREITAVHIEGEKKFEKFTLSDYKWITYAEAKERADHFGAGQGGRGGGRLG